MVVCVWYKCSFPLSISQSGCDFGLVWFGLVWFGLVLFCFVLLCFYRPGQARPGATHTLDRLRQPARIKHHSMSSSLFFASRLQCHTLSPQYRHQRRRWRNPQRISSPLSRPWPAGRVASGKGFGRSNSSPHKRKRGGKDKNSKDEDEEGKQVGWLAGWSVSILTYCGHHVIR